MNFHFLTSPRKWFFEHSRFFFVQRNPKPKPSLVSTWWISVSSRPHIQPNFALLWRGVKWRVFVVGSSDFGRSQLWVNTFESRYSFWSLAATTSPFTTCNYLNLLIISWFEPIYNLSLERRKIKSFLELVAVLWRGNAGSGWFSLGSHSLASLCSNRVNPVSHLQYQLP